MTDRELAKTMVEIMPRTTRLIGAFMAMSPHHQLTLPQVRTLSRLSLRDHINSELAKSMGVSIPAMSRMIDGLVKRRLVKRTRSTKDRRISTLAMTAAGRNVFNRAKEKAQDSLIDLMAPLSKKDKDVLKKALVILTQLISVPKG